MDTRRTVCLLTLASFALLLPPPTLAQVVSGHSLKGEWIRTDSTNDPNDLMRIDIDVKGVLTVVPPAVRFFRTGQVLWQAIQGGGSVQVLGGDGQYHPSTITMNGPDEIQLVIHHSSTVGTQQTWNRAGPDISGDWVRVATSGSPWDGTRIDVQGVDGSIRYLPARAPRYVRIGRQLWRSVGVSGGLQVLGSDGNYHPASWRLPAADRIEVDASAIAGGPGQVWVRPTIVVATRAGLSGPPQNPNTPGSGLTPPAGSTGIPTPVTPPGVTLGGPRACLATSRPHDSMGVNWDFVIDKFGYRDRPREESMGLTPFLAGTVPPSSGDGGNATVDIERVLLPDGSDGFAYLWEWRDLGKGHTWRRSGAMTPASLDQEIRKTKAAGERPMDIERYPDALSTLQLESFYRGLWEANPEGIDWKLEYDLTDQEYGAAFRNYRNNGYRLIDMEAHHMTSGVRYSAIWWASCNDANWKQVRNLDRDAYDARVNREAARGFNVIDFESYQTPAGQRYAAIMERTTPGQDWAVRSDRDFTGFLNFHREYVDLGMRLVDFESYDTANGVRYAGVWAENRARYDYALRPAVEDSVTTYMTQHSIPGVSVVAIRNDEVIYQGGFGWADVGAGKRAWSGTVYPTASIAKVVGATLAARFEEQGLIDLSLPTSDFLDYLAADKHTHTVEQLLSKIGCMYHYPEGPEPSSTDVYAYRRPAVEEMDDNDSGLLPSCTPGSDYRYSTHGFTYVGAVLEEVLGKTIYDVIREELTVPFQLWDLEPMAWESFGEGPYVGQGTPPYELAQGYWWAGGSSGAQDYENTSWKVLGGGLQSTALDLARFGQLSFNETIVSAGTRDTVLLRAVTTSTTPNLAPALFTPIVGLGWVLTTRNSRNVAEHSGDTSPGWGGGSPTLRIYTDPTDSGLVIAVMNNQRNTSAVLNVGSQPGQDDQPVESLATAIAGAILANLPRP